MPVLKRSLTKSEMAAHLARAERMLASGVNIQIREEWQENARALDKALDIAVGGGCATLVFDLRADRAGYAIWVRLVGRAIGAVLDCRLTTSWDDHIALASFSDDGNPVCRLGLVEFPRGQVLNQRLENSMRFARGQLIEGVILATGVKPIPEAYRHGLIVPITLAFLDQNENEIRENADLYVDRMWKPKRKFIPRGNGLYDRGRIAPTRQPVIGQDPNVPRAPGRVGKLP
jgi:hypothetical protein